MKKIDVTQPYAMSSPFADGVYSSVSTSDFEIPADTSTAPDDTCVIDDGFLPITSTDLDDGGIAPERKNFNGMFYLSTDQRFYLQNGGFITYNSNVATAIGGYPQDAVLGFIDGQGTYKLVRSLIDDNTNDFTQDETLIDGEHWEEIAMGGSGSGYQMFDIVMKDHVLSPEETLGLAPLGTYVYKEAIAGSRYGYPDFYQKCVNQYNDGTNVSEYESSNITIVGTLTNNDGVLSGFTANTNYAYTIMQNYFAPGSNPWTLVIKAKMGSTPTANVGFSSISYKSLNLYIPANSNNVTVELSSNNSTFDIGSIASTGLQTNTYYWFKVEFTGTAYNYYVSTDGIAYTLQGTIASSTPIYQNNSGVLLGVDYNLSTGGDITIDLNESYLNVNGSRFWTGINLLTYTENSNKHRFYDIADKATFDNMYAITGEAWYYGVDTTNERIFLPRSTRFKNGTTSDVGGYQSAGLPNITGSLGEVAVWQGSSEEGALSKQWGGPPLAGGSGSCQATKINLNASNSNSIYGASDTVEYSSTKLIPYMVVGNVANESAVTDVVDVTTTENDTLPLFTGIYFDYAPNNVSWVMAGRQVVSGTIYTFAYNELVNELTTPKYNLNVIDVDDMVVGTDYSTYWKVDQTNQTFTCPTRLSYGAFTGGIKGNGLCVGITNGSQTAGLSHVKNVGIDGQINNYGVSVGTINTGNAFGGDVAVGVTTDDTKSGIVATESTTAKLYFKVANAVQNLELLDAGAVLTAVNNVSAKVDNTVHITETYSNGTSWYRVYSDGWCEQGGLTGIIADHGTATVNLLKSFKDLDYTITKATMMPSSGDDTSYNDATCIRYATRTTSSFQIYNRGAIDGGRFVNWQACGYIS